MFVPIISAMVIWPSGLRRQRLIGCLPDGAARAEDTEHRGETQIFLIRRENGPDRIQTRTAAPLRAVVVFFAFVGCNCGCRASVRVSRRDLAVSLSRKSSLEQFLLHEKKSCWEFLEKWWNNKQKKNGRKYNIGRNLLLTNK